MDRTIKRRLLSGLTALAVIAAGIGTPTLGNIGLDLDISVSAADVVSSGTCGDPAVNEGKNVTWTLDSEGKLTFRGSGDMGSYMDIDPPWQIEGFSEDIKSVVIENGITNISDGAFAFCTSLSSIEIPDSVTSIGNYAFFFCSALESIVIPEGVTEIGNYAFYSCSELSEITFPKSVSSIGISAFYDTKWLEAKRNENSLVIESNILIDGQKAKGAVEIPEGVTAITATAFSDNPDITSVTIPGTVKDIGSTAFYSCQNLSDVTIKNGAERIGVSTFSQCLSLTSIVIPNSVTYIGNGAFYMCNNLSEITFPENVEFIGTNAFTGTKWLDERINEDLIVIVNGILIDGKKAEGAVVIPNGVKSIADSAFLNSHITSVKIADSVKSIGYGSFEGCKELAEAIIPEGVESIGDYAFWECSSLEELFVPGSVKSIGDLVFTYCSKLKSISVSENNENYSSYDGVLYNKDKSVLICCPVSKEEVDIFDGVKVIGERSFIMCRLNSVTIPGSVTSIEDWAFDECKSLKRVIIPDGVKSIGNYAFSDCPALESVTIPKSITGIGGRAFGYYHDEEYYLFKKEGFRINCYKDSAAYDYAVENGFDYRLLDDEFIKIAPKYTLKEGEAAPDLTKLKVTVFDSTGAIAAETNADAQGNVSLEDLANGSYTLKIELDGFAPRSMEYTPGDDLGDIALCKHGDCDGNGSVNLSDLGLLQQKLCDWDVEFVYPEAGDADGNGKTDLSDLGRLQQYLCDWDVTLGPDRESDSVELPIIPA